jgi:Flp pilus assembly pilin Flp
MRYEMKRSSKVRRRARREDGAAAVEFALIVGLLAMLIFGMMEFGLAFWQLQSLRAAAREGARVAAVGGDEDQIRDAVVGASAGALPAGYTGLTFNPVGGCPEPGDAPIDQSVTVSIDPASLPSGVQQIFSIDIPLLPSFSLNPQIEGTFRCEPV